MPTNVAFNERIRERLQLAQSEKLRRLRETGAEMRAWTGGRQRIHATVEALYREHFSNLEVETIESRTGPAGVARLEPTERFPATTTLVLSVHRAPEEPGLVVGYRLEILPMLMEYEAEDQLRLLRFVDTYLRLETNSYYPARNARTDPVCGMHLWTTTAACTAEHAGRTLHFCSESCRDRFLAEPERFVS